MTADDFGIVGNAQLGSVIVRRCQDLDLEAAAAPFGWGAPVSVVT